MTIKYLETDITDEGPIRWYGVDDETYGLDAEGKILESDGTPVTDTHEAQAVIRVIAKFEASK